jgi:hypothetical protein
VEVAGRDEQQAVRLRGHHPAWIRCLFFHHAELLAENLSFSQNKFERKRRFLSVSAFPALQKLFLPQRGASQ